MLKVLSSGSSSSESNDKSNDNSSDSSLKHSSTENSPANSPKSSSTRYSLTEALIASQEIPFRNYYSILAHLLEDHLNRFFVITDNVIHRPILTHTGILTHADLLNPTVRSILKVAIRMKLRRETLFILTKVFFAKEDPKEVHDIIKKFGEVLNTIVKRGQIPEAATKREDWFQIRDAFFPGMNWNEMDEQSYKKMCEWFQKSLNYLTEITETGNSYPGLNLKCAFNIGVIDDEDNFIPVDGLLAGCPTLFQNLYNKTLHQNILADVLKSNEVTEKTMEDIKFVDSRETKDMSPGEKNGYERRYTERYFREHPASIPGLIHYTQVGTFLKTNCKAEYAALFTAKFCRSLTTVFNFTGIILVTEGKAKEFLTYLYDAVQNQETINAKFLNEMIQKEFQINLVQANSVKEEPTSFLKRKKRTQTVSGEPSSSSKTAEQKTVVTKNPLFHLDGKNPEEVNSEKNNNKGAGRRRSNSTTESEADAISPLSIPDKSEVDSSRPNFFGRHSSEAKHVTPPIAKAFSAEAPATTRREKKLGPALTQYTEYYEALALVQQRQSSGFLDRNTRYQKALKNNQTKLRQHAFVRQDHVKEGLAQNPELCTSSPELPTRTRKGLQATSIQREKQPRPASSEEITRKRGTTLTGDSTESPKSSSPSNKP